VTARLLVLALVFGVPGAVLLVVSWLRSGSCRWVYRAGWPDQMDLTPSARGPRWVRIGPWVLGDVAAWDQSGAP
jgi:hypothetical protein